MDLDFFGRINADSEELRDILREVGRVEVASVSKNINIFWINGVKVDMVNYPYPWLDLPIVEDGVRLHFALDEILDMYSRKYSDGSLFIVMKSLTYFDDAETDPMPNVLNDTTWETVKDFLRKVVRNSSI